MTLICLCIYTSFLIYTLMLCIQVLASNQLTMAGTAAMPAILFFG